MTSSPQMRQMKGDGPASGPFAALWVLLKELLKSWGKGGFEAAFERLEAQTRQVLLEQVIAPHNEMRPEAWLNVADFEMVLVRRGRRAEYEIFTKDGRALFEVLGAAAATIDADAAAMREYFDARRMLARYQRLTQLGLVSRKRARRIPRRLVAAAHRRLQARRTRAFACRRIKAPARADLVLAAGQAPP